MHVPRCPDSAISSQVFALLSQAFPFRDTLQPPKMKGLAWWFFPGDGCAPLTPRGHLAMSRDFSSWHTGRALLRGMGRNWDAAKHFYMHRRVSGQLA